MEEWFTIKLCAHSYRIYQVNYFNMWLNLQAQDHNTTLFTKLLMNRSLNVNYFVSTIFVVLAKWTSLLANNRIHQGILNPTILLKLNRKTLTFQLLHCSLPLHSIVVETSVLFLFNFKRIVGLKDTFNEYICVLASSINSSKFPHHKFFTYTSRNQFLHKGLTQLLFYNVH